MASPTTKSKKAKKNRRRTNRSKGGSVAQLSAGSLPMHPCALMYAKAALDPWDPSIMGKCCIPDDDDQSSFKFTSRLRGTFTIGTGGVGFVAANPQAMATSNLNALVYSLTAFALAGFPGASAANTASQNGTGYNSTLANTCLQRVVSCGMKVRYTGTELNRGGQMIPVKATSSNNIQAGQNDSLNSQTLSNILSRYNTRSDPCTRSWKGTVWTPSTPSERSYLTPSTLDDALTSTTGQILGVVVNGTAGNTYEYDCICHSELIPLGITTLPSMSASDSDSSGYSYIRNFLGGLYQDEIGQKVFKTFATKAGKELLRHINPQARLEY